MSVLFDEKFMRTLQESLGAARGSSIAAVLGPIIKSDPVTGPLMSAAPESAAQTVIGIANVLGPDASVEEIAALYKQGMAQAVSPGKSAKKKWWRFGR